MGQEAVSDTPNLNLRYLALVSFENKFAHDEELKFKVNAKRNKYLGQWVSKVLGYNEDDQKKYIQDLIKAARDMGVSVGPGRGSAAGAVVALLTCLLAYLLIMCLLTYSLANLHAYLLA